MAVLPVDTAAAGTVLGTAAAALVAFPPLEWPLAGAEGFGRVGAADGLP